MTWNTNAGSGSPEAAKSLNGAVFIIPCDADGVPVGYSPGAWGGGSVQGGATGYATDVTASWYTQTATVISLLKLMIATYIDAGSHAYTYNTDGSLATDAWTFLGTTRTKTYTYTNGRITAESDWV